MALGVPSLRLASREPAEPGLDSCLTRLANDQPCSSRDMDEETGEPSTPCAEDADHRRVRMGTSSFNKQERLAKKEVEDQPDKPEPAKRQRAASDASLEAGVEAEMKPRHESVSSVNSNVAEGKSTNAEQELQASKDISSLEAKTGGKRNKDNVEFGKLSSEFNTLLQDGKQQPDGWNKETLRDGSPEKKEHKRSHSADSSSSSKLSSGHSSPVQERPKQMSFELPDEMRLAAGAAQDRRSRVDRPARSALFSSTEVLAAATDADKQMTPTEDQPASDKAELQEDKQETSSDERTHPVAMPRGDAGSNFKGDRCINGGHNGGEDVAHQGFIRKQC